MNSWLQWSLVPCSLQMKVPLSRTLHSSWSCKDMFDWFPSQCTRDTLWAHLSPTSVWRRHADNFEWSKTALEKCIWLKCDGYFRNVDTSKAFPVLVKWFLCGRKCRVERSALWNLRNPPGKTVCHFRKEEKKISVEHSATQWFDAAVHVCNKVVV